MYREIIRSSVFFYVIRGKHVMYSIFIVNKAIDRLIDWF